MRIIVLAKNRKLYLSVYLKKDMQYWFLAFLMVCGVVSNAQQTYGLKTMRLPEFVDTIKRNPDKTMINLENYIPKVKLDIRYATTNNFMGKKMYSLPRAYARKPVAIALKKAQAEFESKGYGIKIFDAYRPYQVTVAFYEEYGDTTYVASPYRGSRHNRGCAIDMTLYDLITGEDLIMPTEYDVFSKEAWPSTPMRDPVKGKNREILVSVMQKYGFRVNSSEWWHFDFIGYRKYEVLDIPFESLDELIK
jgi:D-alanyl-D-alanine dipeptidase